MSLSCIVKRAKCEQDLYRLQVQVRAQFYLIKCLIKMVGQKNIWLISLE